MSLHEEFEAARKNAPSVTWYLQPLSGRLAALADDAPEHLRKAILRARAGESRFDSTLGFTLEMPNVDKTDFTQESLERLPGYRALVTYLSDPDIDTGFTIRAEAGGKLAYNVVSVTVSLDPANAFRTSSLQYYGLHSSDRSYTQPYKEGRPGWATTKPKLRGLTVTQ